ncbi:uncharacterized protein PFL1_06373 [Pseudozyma flocculosa PF-1]|uniref:DH domain-containing protein n=1 Tax=Pseudozyma flocculosa PF-1 TaxID=1277687 RepID=A0A061H2W0_9BASI|nr:uncharacterized protein PFL1_06373 [Pseudozyma flocculosa PF-1]EPQ26165.1 hypothetical protein PFL1_06373 [Pseudozyma flocculosa PF-1]
MKRFFSRFSTTPSNPPPLSPAQPFDQTWEKSSDLPTDFAPGTKPANNSTSRSTGQRVKALAAKYESQAQTAPNAAAAAAAANDNPASAPAIAGRDGQASDGHKPLPLPPSLDLRLSPLSTSNGLLPPTTLVGDPEDANAAPAPALDGLGLRSTAGSGLAAVDSRPTRAPPRRAPSAPAISAQGAVAYHDGTSGTVSAVDERHRQKDQRQPSGSSQGSAHAAAVPKSVAFAPSPEKPSHGSQHGHGHAPPPPRSTSPSPASHNLLAAPGSRHLSADGASRTLSSPADSGYTGNFARPTVASQARARSSGRLSGSEGLGWGSASVSASNSGNGGNGGGGGGGGSSSASATPVNERPPSLVAPRSAKMSRANSLQSSARRQANGANAGAGSDVEGVAALTISSPTMIGSPASASTSSLGHGGSPHARSSLEANSIPFASLGQPAPPALRSSSPISFGTPASTPMQITGSGGSSSGHAWRPDSRRGSFAPSSLGSGRDSHIFPFGSIGGRQFGVPSWSEMTQEELVHNLGPRERTRQEVLWEIVASEERYVAELEKVKELYIDALLHPDQFDPERLFGPPTAPPSTTSPSDAVSPRIDTALVGPHSRREREPTTPSDSDPASGLALDLPIAARFMSGTAPSMRTDEDGTGSASGHGSSLYRIDSAAQAQADRHRAAGNRSPYSVGLLNSVAATAAASSTSTPVQHRPADSRRNSLTGQGSAGRRGAQGASSRSSLAHGLGLGIGPGRASTARGTVAAAGATEPSSAARPKQSRGSAALSKVQKLRDRSRAAGEGDPMVLAVPLPRSLKAVLESISEGLVESHALLSDTLKARYEEQWPLVRSLADVFMRYSYILQHYAAYVCHLQRALEELEEAALMERAMRGKRIKRERLSHTVGLGRTVSALEAAALERGHGGLSIFVSMPFQRLLKYPLLFQNLLFHTDPSTHEFESTVAMVVEVERLVRSIEDEKVNAEERDKTRDAFARIEGLTDRQILRPRPDRTLIEEKALYDESQRRTVSESAPKDLLGAAGAGADASDHEGLAGSGTDTPSKIGGGGSSRWNTSPGLRAALRSKRSYRRLSDFLSTEDKGGASTKAPSMGSKKDLWLVRFSDVEIKCQRVGVTALPMVSSAALTLDGAGATAPTATSTMAATTDEESAEMDFARRSKESKERLKALRSTTLRAKTRNLYRFVSVVAWRTAARQAGAPGVEGDGGGIDGLPTSHEVDEENEDDGLSGDSDSASSDGRSSESTSSGDEADGGFAAPSRYRSSLGPPPVVGGAMSNRLAEPLAATSINSAPEAVQSAVARMHAKRRNDKFGGRMRGGMSAPSGASHSAQAALQVQPAAGAGAGAGAGSGVGATPSPDSSAASAIDPTSPVVSCTGAAQAG